MQTAAPYRSAKFQLIELRIGQDLAERLGVWRRAGVAAAAMARLLTLESGVPLTGETVRSWLRDLDRNGGPA